MAVQVGAVLFENVKGRAGLYCNGQMYLERMQLGVDCVWWKVSVDGESGDWCSSPEDALANFVAKAVVWAPILREIARINSGRV